MGSAAGRGVSQIFAGVGEWFLNPEREGTNCDFLRGKGGGIERQKWKKMLFWTKTSKSKGGTVVNKLLVWGEHFFGRGGYSPPPLFLPLAHL